MGDSGLGLRVFVGLGLHLHIPEIFHCREDGRGCPNPAAWQSGRSWLHLNQAGFGFRACRVEIFGLRV